MAGELVQVPVHILDVDRPADVLRIGIVVLQPAEQPRRHHPGRTGQGPAGGSRHGWTVEHGVSRRNPSGYGECSSPRCACPRDGSLQKVTGVSSSSPGIAETLVGLGIVTEGRQKVVVLTRRRRHRLVEKVPAELVVKDDIHLYRVTPRILLAPVAEAPGPEPAGREGDIPNVARFVGMARTPPAPPSSTVLT